MNQRLQKILSAKGVASRRKAEELIAAGRITVNGAVANLGDSADPALDKILLDGKPLGGDPAKVYIMLNKPRGYVTTLSDEKGRKTVASLVEDCGCRVYPVGRLDMSSEGLLLLTNDGETANKLAHPSNLKDKTYLVSVTGDAGEKLHSLRSPMVIDGYKTAGADVSVYDKNEGGTRLLITIHEGRNRQIRKMCESAGLEVRRLIRISEAGVKLGNLKSGRWRHLTADERRLLGIE